MTRSIETTRRAVARLARFGDSELLADWEVEGYVAVFSINHRKIWAAPRHGPASHRSDLEGEDDLLDKIAAIVRARQAIGGRVYVTKWGVEGWVSQGVGEKIIRFVILDAKSLPAPDMPIASLPTPTCPRCRSEEYVAGRCGMCRFEGGEART